MSLEESSQYDYVKIAKPKTYELVFEAYRQHFRSSQEQDAQVCTEFGREKEVQFDCWCIAKQVTKDYNKLCQLMLLEEFTTCLTSK